MKTITDYLTGEELKFTPEEPSRQTIMKLMVEDYDYPKNLLQKEFGVKRSPSDTRRSLPVDLAIFENEADKRAGKSKIFVETKKPSSKEGKDQLKNYMELDPHVKYGIWFNGDVEDGESILFIKKVYKNGVPAFEETHNVPRHKFFDISEEIRIGDLRPTNNLKSIFKNLRGFIAANAVGTTRDETILNQIALLIIAKLYEERFSGDEEMAKFRVWNASPNETFVQINNIFNAAKGKWPGIFDEHEKITLSPTVLLQIVSQLQIHTLKKSPRNVVSEAFESIIAYATKGSQGQFFTPSNIVELMVNIARPSDSNTVFDPALGTGGFLSSSMFYVWKQIDQQKWDLEDKALAKISYATNNLFGIEKDSFLAKIAKAYMIIMGDGKSGLFVADSLDEESWDHTTKSNISAGKFDYILTNPPFGKEVKVRSDLAQKYEFGNKIELAFVEQSLKYLKDGGILGIILPETIFHSPSNNKMREKLFFSHNITHLIDLPHDTFRPYNNAKCNIIFLQKNREQGKEVHLIKVNEIGHDHLGRPKYILDEQNKKTELPADDIPKLIQMVNEEIPFDADHFQKINASELLEQDLLVARPFFKPVSSNSKLSLQQLIDEGVITFFDGHGSPRSELKGLGERPYVRVKDIVNLEICHNRLDDIPQEEYDRLWSPTKELKELDIVFVRRGSYRIGDVGILYKKDLQSILTREILVLRVHENEHGITPFNLLALLNQNDVRNQVRNKVLIDTTLPNIAHRWKEIFLDLSDENMLNELDEKMKLMYQKRAEYWESYADLFY